MHPTNEKPQVVKLHLGCGQDYWPGYVNIDVLPNSKADMMMSYLEIDRHFEPDSVDEVVMIHSLNYVPLWEARDFFAKVQKVLKAKGQLIIETVNLEKAARHMLENIGNFNQYLEGVRGIYGFGLDHLQKHEKYTPNVQGWTPWHLQYELNQVGFDEIEILSPQTHVSWRDMRVVAIKAQSKSLIGKASQNILLSASSEVSTGKVLFVLDPVMGHVTSHLRGLIFKESFQEHGWQVEYVNIREVDENTIVELSKNFDVVYLLKIASLSLVKKLKQLSPAKLIFDLTDALWKPFHRQAGWQDLEKILETVDVIFSENEYICAYGRKFKPYVYSLPACTQIERFDTLHTQVEPRNDGKVRIGWIGSAGTISAIESIRIPLENILTRHPEVEISLLGCPENYTLLVQPDRFTLLPHYNEDDMLQEILHLDIGLFPPPADLEDYAVRGALKAMLYMSGGVVPVCQRAGDCEKIIVDGVTGMLASNLEEWEAKLEALVTSPEQRRQLGQRGIEVIREKHSLPYVFSRTVEALTCVINGVEPPPHLLDTNPVASKGYAAEAKLTLVNGKKPRLLLIADVPNWIFARHCRNLQRYLSDEFDITIEYQDQPYNEDNFDLIYPLEWNLVKPEQIHNPAKYVTGIRSHVSWKNYKFADFVNYLATQFQQVHVVSQRLYQIFAPHLPTVDYVTHGIDTTFFTPAISPTQTEQKIRIGWAGNRKSAENKGFSDILEPLGRLPGVELIYCGYSDTLLSLEDMHQFYSSLDIYICASVQEGSNNSLLEAAAMERAIITTDNGTVPEYLQNGVSALIVERQLPTFIQAVETLRDDPAQRMALGKAARAAVVNGWDWRQKVEDYRLFFRRALTNLGQTSAAVLPPRSEPGQPTITPSFPPEVLSSLAEAERYFQQGDFAAARDVLTQALDLAPDNLQLIGAYGNILLQLGELEDARRQFVKATVFYPDYIPAYVDLAITLLQLNRLDEAESAIQRALKLNPTDTNALKAWAQLCLNTERYAEGVKTYADILRGNPDDTDALLTLGTCYVEVEDYTSALAVYQRTFALLPPGELLETVQETILKLQNIIETNSSIEPVQSAVERASASSGVMLSGEQSFSFCIITAGKRPDLLNLVVKSIRVQNIPNYEIIVVGKYHPEPGIIYVPAEEAAASGSLGQMRNLGVAKAQYDHIVILDDDIILTANWYQAFLNFGDDFDILTSRILLPDGTRYWDHATIDGPRGHRLLRSDEQDEQYVYMSGGTAWIMKGYVAQSVHWNETLNFNEKEDVDFARKCQEKGFRILHNPDNIAYHHAAKYTRLGRINLARLPDHTNLWLLSRSDIQTPDTLLRLIQEKTANQEVAELADCLRAGLQVFPDDVRFRNLWKELEQMYGGDVLGDKWYLHGDPKFAELINTLDQAETPTSTPVLSISWAANIFDFSGYAWLSRQILPTLAQRDVSLEAQSFTADEKLVAQLKSQPTVLATWQHLLKQQVNQGVYVIFHPPVSWGGEDYFAHCRQHNPGFDAYVGITMFETDRLPAGWSDACNQMDEVWVPATFNRDTFINAGVNPAKLQVIPFGLDTNIYDPARVTPLDIPEKQGFTFLSVFQWSKRKGWDVLLKAYLSAFSAEDDVSLVIRAYPGYVKEPSLRQRLDAYMTALGYDPHRIPPIILLEQFIAESEMPALYAAADTFVLPTRGEGWGIPFMEAMAMGCPVIGTRWSAHLDFMSDVNSYLIDIEGLAPVDPEQTQENPFYTSDQQWAEPSITHTATLMRRVYEHQTEARAKGAQARRDIQQHWTLDHTANWIIERVDHLSKTSPSNFHGSTNGRLPSLISNLQSPSVLWHAPIYDPSGYADEARNFILQLRAQQVNIAARSIGRHSTTFQSQLTSETQASLDHALAHQPDRNYISLIHFPAYAFQRLDQAAYNIGRVMFETDGLPADWIAKCNQMDEIWVPTEFNLQTFRNAGVTAKLVKIPGGIDTDRFRPGLEPLPIPGARGQIFLSIFEWGYRKGWDVLLRAWAKAFRPSDDVCLVLRTYPINQTDGFDAQAEIEQRINHFLKRKLKLSRQKVAPIIVLGEQVSEQDLPHLHAAATAYVSCSRGEGWGRPQMQAMACGLPVIATRWGGNLEFMTETNSLLLDVEALVKIDERAEIPFYRGQCWAEPSVKHLVTLLRRIYDNPTQAATIGQQARQDMVEKWQWSTVAAIAAERLQAIQADLAPKPTKHDPTTQPITLRWEGSQFVIHSLALINREICLRLAQDEQFDLAIIPYEQHQFGPEVDPRFKNIEKNLNRTLSRSADVHIRHQWPPDLSPPAEGHWVMIQPWEFGSLPKEWIAVMREKVDEVWAYTNYVRNCYIQSGLPEDRVFVVPPGVDTGVFRPDTPPLSLKTKKQFKFLFVGGTIVRKGIDILLDAYAHTFTAADDVCLVIKDMGGQSFYQGRTAQEMIAKIQRTPGAPEIEYIDRTLNDAELAGLYTACDCLAHPYRGEGFGLPIAEAMAAGLPVIVTGYGAALDFCHPDNSYLIPARTVQLPEKRIGERETVDYPWWAEPDVEALKVLLRRAFTQPQEAKAKGQQGMAIIRANFTWDHAANAVRERLKILRDKPIQRLVSRVVTEPQPQNGTFATKAKSETSGDSMANNNILDNVIEAMQQAGQWPQAIQLLQEAVKYARPGSESSALWNSLGVCYFQTGQFSEAETAFGQGLNTDPENLDLLHNLAELYLQQEAYDRATEYLNRALRVNPDDVNILLSLGHCALMLDAFDVALLAYRRVKTLAPETAGIDQIIKEIELSDQPDESSTNGYQSTNTDVTSTQETANQVLAAGQTALEQGDLELAAKEFAWVVAQYPGLAAAQMALGSTFLALGQNEVAAASFRRLNELLPKLTAGHNQLGIALYRLGQLGEAEAAFQRANRLDPADLEPLLNLVDLYRSQQRYDEAAEAVKAALTLDSNHPDVLIAFGLLSLERGDKEGAEMAWQRLPHNIANHPGVLALGQALGYSQPGTNPITQIITQVETTQLKGEWREGVAMLQSFIKQNQSLSITDRALILNRLGYCHFMAGQLIEAEAVFKQGLEIAPDHLDLLNNLADLYAQQEQFDQATTYLNHALTIAPTDIQLLLSLGQCAIQLGVYDVALLAFQRVQSLAPETEGISEVVEQLQSIEADIVVV